MSFSTPSDLEYRTAQALGCNPSEPSSWPWSIVEQLILIKENYGEDKYWREMRKLMSPK